ncbi:MAG: efflux transporter periplasmic adaptor subunit, partial [Deltaproteobacteria bacterium]
VVKDNIVYYLAIVKVNTADAAFLRPEMTAYVKIIYDERKNVLVAPNAAVKFEEGKQVVYRVTGPRNDQAQKTPVTIGARGEEETEILSGVAEGDVLATKIILPVKSKSAGGGRPSGRGRH